MGRKFVVMRDPECDDISDVSDDLDLGGETVRSDLKSRLLEQIREHQDVSVVSAPGSEELICCEVCHKWFQHPIADSVVVCPYCGKAIEQEELSEIRLSNPTLAFHDLSVLLDKHKEQQQKKDNWEDGRKEQISLEMGSAEYLERVEDLKLHDPFKPDDEWHETLEQQNEDQVTKRQDEPEENPYAEEDTRNFALEEKLRSEQEKRALHAKAVRAALASAALTESMADDELAKAITTDNELIYDPTVRPKEYIEKLDDYVAEMSL